MADLSWDRMKKENVEKHHHIWLLGTKTNVPPVRMCENHHICVQVQEHTFTYSIWSRYGSNAIFTIVNIERQIEKRSRGND